MNTTENKVYPFKLPKSEYPNFSERLKYTMLLRNCSVHKLAKDLFVSSNTIYSYRSGSRSPDIHTLYLMCRSLNVTSDFLIGLQDDIYL